jgi:hypothetical protein
MATIASYISFAMRKPSIADRLQPRGTGRPEQRPHEPFAPAARFRLGRQQLGDIGIVEPQIA